jgi:adenylylsulfate kinase
MTEQKATNVYWHDGEVSREDRNKLLKQKGATPRFTP